MKPINIFLLPSGNRNNKYIELLTNAIRASSPDIHVIALQNDRLPDIFSKLRRPEVRDGKNIIHVHWSTVLYGSKYAVKSIFLIVRNAAILFILKTVYGFKVVSTAHNFFAHDYPHPFIDAIGRSMLRSFSDCITVHEESTANMYKVHFPRKRIEHVPHGNYVGAYGDLMPRNRDLRASLGFSDEDIVLLSLGAIAPYKRNEEIIDAVRAARVGMPTLKLLIVGKGKPEYVNTLVSRASADSGIIVKNMFVPDAEIPRYFSIADQSIFYYDRSEMTSGGIILSLSYGVPVITRNIPASEIIDGKNGHVFTDRRELEDILKRIESFKTAPAHDIINNIRKFDWSHSAAKLRDIYQNI